MEEKPTDSAPPLKCEVCLKEIPKSLAKSVEGAEYVYYFCGDKCYAQWEENDQPKPPEETK